MLSQGEVIAECSIETHEGVRIAEVVWTANKFIDTFAYKTPYPKAPDISVEIVSPSSSKAEIANKVNLYLANGAHAVWIVHENRRVDTFTHTGEVQQSSIAPTAPTVKT